MPVCSFDSQYQMFDITPVDNLFIEDYMIHANGDFVRVYLYGLRLCYSREDSDLGRIAQVLRLKEETVLKAFAYWERQGLVVRLSDNPPSFAYVNLRARFTQSEPQERDDPAIYSMAAFNNALMRMLPTRFEHDVNFRIMYDLMDESGMTDTALLMIVEDMANDAAKKGKNPPTVNAIKKKVMELAEQKIISDDAVRHHLRTSGSEYADIKALLRHMGIIKDAPSLAEEELFAKWKAMGYTLDVLKLFCGEMTKIQRPTFDYLDKIVRGYYDKGLISQGDIIRYKDVDLKPVEQIRAELMIGGENTDELFRLYIDWTSAGIEPELIFEAARDAKKYARGNRLVYLRRTIERSKESNIRTLSQYIQQREKKSAARSTSGGGVSDDRSKRLSKPVAAQNYKQRKYEEKDLEANLTNFDTFGEDMP